MPEKTPNEDIFLIPYQAGQYLIYLPFRKAVLLGNAAMGELLRKAALGDPEALRQLGLGEDFFTVSPGSLEERLRRPPAASGLPEFKPTAISLFLTNKCPLRCTYCYAEGGKNALQMPFDMAAALLDEIVENAAAKGQQGITVNYHGGGDVTAAWELLTATHAYALEKTRGAGLALRSSIGLSGVLSERQREWVLRHIGGATISLDGNETYNKHRVMANGRPSFPYVHETLKKFDEARYPYGLRCTITEDTVEHMEEIVKFFCEEYEVRQIKVEPMFPAGRAPQNGVNAPSARAFVRYFRKARDIAEAAGRQLLYSGVRFETLSNIFCQASGDSCAVTPEGWVTSCYEVLDMDNPHAATFFYGKYDASSRKMKVDDRVREGLFALNVLNRPSCADCFCKWHCAGDCPVKALEAEHLSEGAYPDRCHINRELTKDLLIRALDE
jgi:uncharacterized protein